MKYFKYIAPILLSLFWACENEEFDYIPDVQVDGGSIKLLGLRSDHWMMLPDGKATMKFYPEAYNILELPNYTPTYKGDTALYIPSIKRDTSLIPTSMLPEGLFTLYDDKGNVYPDFTFKTDDTTPRVVKFHVVAGELKSEELSIEIRPFPTVQYEELEIPVIFHVMNQPSTPGIPTILIEKETVYKRLERMNEVFSGKATSDPNGWNTRIKFVPALYDNNGSLLENPGIHMHEIPSTTVLEKDQDFSDYVFENADQLIFDYKHFLNIWLINNPKGSSSIVKAPTLIDDPDNPILGLVAEKEIIPFPSEPEDVGFFVSMSYFVNPMQSTDYYEISTVMGKYLGLLVTKASESSFASNFKNGDTDYCPDTPFYWTNTQSVYKTDIHSTWNPENIHYFTSYNIMDSYSYKNSITLDQVNRIRQILGRCPSRWMYKSKFALTGKME